MTTDSHRPSPAGVSPVLRGGVLAVLGVALVLAGVGALVDGAPAGWGALVGAGLVLAVLAGGSLVVDLVATVAPGLAMLVALTTYLLQVVLTGLGFLVLSRSGLLGDTLDRGWTAGGVVLATLVWVVVQVVLTTRLRIPAYDLPDAAARPTGPVVPATSAPAQAGDR